MDNAPAYSLPGFPPPTINPAVVSPQSTPKNHKTLYIILTIVGIIVILGIVFWFNITNSNIESIEKNTDIDATTSDSQENSNKADINRLDSSEIKDCGTDIDCFINEANNCQISKIKYAMNVDLFGIKQTTTDYFEIKGSENNKCNFYLRVDDVKIEFPPQVSEEDANSQRSELEKTKGLESACKYENSKLVELLNNWKNGDFSTSDLNNTDCSGSLIDAQL